MDSKIHGAAAFFSQTGINAVCLRGKISIKICSKNEFDLLLQGGERSAAAFLGILEESCLPDVIRKLPPAEVIRLRDVYIEGICGIIEDYGEYLRIPEASVPLDGALPNCELSAATVAEKLVSEYTGLDMARVEGLNYLIYRLYLADAVKYNLGRTEKGIAYLNTAYAEMFAEFDRQTFLSGGIVNKVVK